MKRALESRFLHLGQLKVVQCDHQLCSEIQSLEGLCARTDGGAGKAAPAALVLPLQHSRHRVRRGRLSRFFGFLLYLEKTL